MTNRVPYLTQARRPLTHAVEAMNEHGVHGQIAIPTERALTIYVDKREIVTLMTLGARPELLVLGYLRNQRLIASADEIESITVDWELADASTDSKDASLSLTDAGVAAVKTRHGIARIEERTARRVVTTGCGQGSIFGGLMDDVQAIALPEARITQSQLYAIVNTIRLQDSTYKAAGSVHGCALFSGDQRLFFVEDVGRHNAIDTIAGWMALQDEATAQGGDKVFYTTGRLTSEMVIKSAQMGVPIVVSRSGITQMGHAVAQQLGLCTIGRATNKRFLCFSAPWRLELEPHLVAPGPVTAAALV